MRKKMIVFSIAGYSIGAGIFGYGVYIAIRSRCKDASGALFALGGALIIKATTLITILLT